MRFDLILDCCTIVVFALLALMSFIDTDYAWAAAFCIAVQLQVWGAKRRYDKNKLMGAP